MSFKVINKTEPIKTETLVCLIYGDPGIGKTSLAFTTNNPLLLDFDGGVQRACFRQTVVRVVKWDEVIALQDSQELKSIAPKTLIIDTAGGMLDNYVADYVKGEDPKNKRRGGELSLQGYGAMKDVFVQFKNWAKIQHINLVFIAHTTTMEEGDNTKFIPKVTGGSYDILRQECDLIGYLTSNKNRRVIDFNPTDAHIGKNCAELAVVEIPDYRKPEYETFLQSLIDQTLAKMNAISEAQTEAVKKIAEFESSLVKIDDLKGINKRIPFIGEETDRAIQLQEFALLKKRATEIGLTYNSTDKLFEIKK
jgi:hypothetical protein